MWVLSSLMMLFEYRRALGHVWYVHPLFWWYSIVVYEADVVLWRTEIHDSKSDPNLVAAFLVASAIALLLGLLSIIYPNDVPYERRNYMATSDRNLKDMMIVQRESESTHRS